MDVNTIHCSAISLPSSQPDGAVAPVGPQPINPHILQALSLLTPPGALTYQGQQLQPQPFASAHLHPQPLPSPHLQPQPLPSGSGQHQPKPVATAHPQKEPKGTDNDDDTSSSNPVSNPDSNPDSIIDSIISDIHPPKKRGRPPKNSPKCPPPKKKNIRLPCPRCYNI